MPGIRINQIVRNMKTKFDKTTRDELINRINTLNKNSIAQWDKMNVLQMLKHNVLWGEMILGRLKCKRILMGRLLGKLALKDSVSNDKPMIRNAVTSTELKVKEAYGDITAEKRNG